MAAERGFLQQLGRAGPMTWVLAAACAWAVLLWIAALLGMGGRIAVVVPVAQPPLPRPSAPVADRIGPLAQYAEAAAHPLFTEDRRPRAFLASGAGDDGAPDAQAFDFLLTGVLISPQVRLAILQPAAGGESQRVREGSAPEGAGGWRLVEVQPRRAVFEGPGGQTTLELRTFGVAGVPAPPRGAEIQVEAASAAAMQAANAAADAAAGNAQAPDEARRIEDIRRRIEARRAQMRSQNPETNDGGARPRPLSGPAR